MVIDSKQQKLILPFKSVAGALLFSVVLGPVGLLYSSLWGGVIMITLCFAALSDKLNTAAMVFWIVSCIWAVAAVNRYNKKVLMMNDNRF